MLLTQVFNWGLALFLSQNDCFALFVALSFMKHCYFVASVKIAEFSVYINAKLKTRTCDTFAKDPSLLPSTYVRQFIPDHNSTSMGI